MITMIVLKMISVDQMHPALVLQRIAMMVKYVPLILVLLAFVIITSQLEQLVLIATHVPMMSAMLLVPAHLLQLIVTMVNHVLLINALLEYANITQPPTDVLITISVPSMMLVISMVLAKEQLRIVMMVMNVLMTLVIQPPVLVFMLITIVHVMTAANAVALLTVPLDNVLVMILYNATPLIHVLQLTAIVPLEVVLKHLRLMELSVKPLIHVH